VTNGPLQWPISRSAGSSVNQLTALVFRDPDHQQPDISSRQRQQTRLRSAPAFPSPRTTARHNLATSFTRALLATRTHRNTQQLSPPCPRKRASKRALHPIHNVKQPKNKRRLDAFLSFSISSFSRGQETGGAERDRTDDLLLAKQALSQLSYGPIK
jgi:hypothetical protein